MLFKKFSHLCFLLFMAFLCISCNKLEYEKRDTSQPKIINNAKNQNKNMELIEKFKKKTEGEYQKFKKNYMRFLKITEELFGK